MGYHKLEEPEYKTERSGMKYHCTQERLMQERAKTLSCKMDEHCLQVITEKKDLAVGAGHRMKTIQFLL